ncbi:hypothetical protein Bbelb_177060 [Branchiostoma belcheri]|nr:hypothetical protein Bbelb_177060 [Branchiostoma belcheri]
MCPTEAEESQQRLSPTGIMRAMRRDGGGPDMALCISSDKICLRRWNNDTVYFRYAAYQARWAGPPRRQDPGLAGVTCVGYNPPRNTCSHLSANRPAAHVASPPANINLPAARYADLLSGPKTVLPSSHLSWSRPLQTCDAHIDVGMPGAGKPGRLSRRARRAL